MNVSEPRPSEHVIAHKQGPAGRVTVHGFRAGRYRDDWITDCGRSVRRDASWLWLEYQTINPSKARLCALCWKEE